MPSRAAIVLIAASLVTGVSAADAAPAKPGADCYYPKFEGYSAPYLREQRHRKRVCLIRFSYEIAAEAAAGRHVAAGYDPALYAADYCQQAYTDEEVMLAKKQNRPLDLQAARTRAAHYAEPWIAQGARLRCVPPSRQ